MQVDKFNFITDTELRNSIETDYNEMVICQKNECWKSVNVLAGSIIEAILVDYLIETGKEERTKLLNYGFSRLIKLAHDHQLISDKTNHLSHSIRNFRNLIHPGRSVRLKDSSNEDQSLISISLVNIISEEIKNKKQVELGYTAEQLINLILSDRNKIHIVNELINETNKKEIERLLLKNIPEIYFDFLEIGEESSSNQRRLLSKFFRTIFELTDKDIKRKVIDKYVEILKNKDSSYISNYETAFFRCFDLKYADPKNIQLVLKHLMPRAYTKAGKNDFAVFQGIGKFLKNKKQTKDFLFDLFLRVFIDNEKEKINKLNKFIKDDYLQDINEENLNLFISEANEWIDKDLFGEGENEEIKKLIHSADALLKTK